VIVVFPNDDRVSIPLSSSIRLRAPMIPEYDGRSFFRATENEYADEAIPMSC
jgi:hypothetical protein